MEKTKKKERTEAQNKEVLNYSEIVHDLARKLRRTLIDGVSGIEDPNFQWLIQGRALNTVFREFYCLQREAVHLEASHSKNTAEQGAQP